jgi:hypothetical protein
MSSCQMRVGHHCFPFLATTIIFFHTENSYNTDDGLLVVVSVNTLCFIARANGVVCSLHSSSQTHFQSLRTP